MEEVIQLVNLVGRAAHDEAFQQELQQSPETVIRREHYPPTVAAVVMRLVPQLSFGKPADDLSLNWWAS